VIDYLSCILFRVTGFLIRCLPVSFSCFLSRRLGSLLYLFDLKHRSIAYANIKTAFSPKLSPKQICRLIRAFYRSFGQNLIEVFFIPCIDKKYFNKYVSFEGLQFIEQAFKKGKGVILLGVHAGSWELSNIICANLGFPFSVLVRDQQKFPRLDQLLNSYRRQKGCKLIERQNQTRQLIEALKNNEAIGLTADQGGRNGVLVKFFGRNASMASGAIRLALKYDSVILPAYYTRVKGPYIKTIIEPPFEVKKTGDEKKDIQDNLQQLMHIYEKNIEKYAKDYLWTYKIWKYSDEKNILILSDGKAGHLRQSQTLAKIAGELLSQQGIKAKVDTVELNFKNSFAKNAMTASSCLAEKFSCQGCPWCLRRFLKEENYKTLMNTKVDIIISCGSSLAAVNYVLCSENQAKSIVIMRPSVLSTKRFDLVIIPRHDDVPRGKNIVVTEGALNLIDEKYLKEQSEKLLPSITRGPQAEPFYIGLLIGGDSKNFSLTKETISEVIRQIQQAAQDLGADILVTTSRRTSREVEELIKKEFRDYARCKLLIIANEKNIPEAVGGILGLSQILITSCESISMISEAASSAKFVLVFDSAGLSRKHRRFLEHFAKEKYIYLTKAGDLAGRIKGIWPNKPEVHTLRDNLLIRQAISKIL